MDNFKLLPVEIVIHLMEFCGGKDLLRLSETCTNFKNIIFSEKKLSGKLRLNILFDCCSKGHSTPSLDILFDCCSTGNLTPSLDILFDFCSTRQAVSTPSLDEIKKITEERKISAVKLISIERSLFFAKDLSVLLPILQHLSLMTEDLYICCNPKKEILRESYRFEETPVSKFIFRGMIGMFLPKLNHLVVQNLLLHEHYQLDTDKRIPIVPNPEGFYFPLKSLTMIDTDLMILENLSCCRNVKKFSFAEKDRFGPYERECALILIFFLMNQPELKVLLLEVVGFPDNYYGAIPITADWIRFPFKLQELKISQVFSACPYTLCQFFENQDQLKKLTMQFTQFLGRQFIETICKLPGLKDLHFINERRTYSSKLEKLFEISNQTVTTITLTRCTSFIGILANIFTSVEKFSINRGDIGNISHVKLEKIWVEPDLYICFNSFDYRPQFPDCKESFERDVLKFVERHSMMFKYVTIVVKPRQAERYEFSLEFCKELVQKLPHLVCLTLSKVAELNKLKEFMATSSISFDEKEEA